MLFRYHRGSLDESMKTIVQINSVHELCELLNVDEKDLKCEPYGYDERIGWDAYVITVSYSVYGFTNGDIRGL